jgi:catalase
MTPEKAVTLTADEAAKKPPNFLVDDLPQRIAKWPVVFHLNEKLGESLYCASRLSAGGARAA